MKLNKAIRLAMECIRAEIKRLNFDANLCDELFSDVPYAKKCSERRKLLYEVIKTLEEYIDDTPKKFDSYDNYCFTCGVPCKTTDAEHQDHERLGHNLNQLLK